jgi:hypothetical protein
MIDEHSIDEEVWLESFPRERIPQGNGSIRTPLKRRSRAPQVQASAGLTREKKEAATNRGTAPTEGDATVCNTIDVKRVGQKDEQLKGIAIFFVLLYPFKHM